MTVVGDVGYLFFRKGEIVHARTLDLEGEAAGLAILGWSQGTFELCERRWPSGPEIRVPWRELLSRASNAATEAHVEARPHGRAAIASGAPERPRDVPNRRERVPPQGPALVSVPLRLSPALLEEQRVNEYVRLSREGAVLAERRCSDSLRHTLVQGLRYADEIGALLSAGPAIAVEARRASSTCMLIRSGGETFGLQGDPTAAAAIQRACGF